MSDWSGNTNSVMKMLAASNHCDEERAENDYYATEPKAIDYLLEKTKIDNNIWEVACGEGYLSKRLIELGYNVKSTDLINRGYGIGGVDFLACKDIWDGDILTNPPYKYALEFCEHALELLTDGHSAWMFVKVQFLEGKARRKLFDTKQLKAIYVSTGRIKCAKNGDFEHMNGSAVAYMWAQFTKGYNGQPTVYWIN